MEVQSVEKYINENTKLSNEALQINRQRINERLGGKDK